MIYPFVSEPRNFEDMENSNINLLHKALKQKGSYKKLNDDEKKLVTVLFDELWHPETYKNGIYKLGGYIFNFSEFTNTYLVKTKYYGWVEIKSFNKTLVRQLSCSKSEIIKIITLEEKTK